MKKTALFIVLALAAGCSEKAPPADTPKPADAPKPSGPPKPPKPGMAPPLSDAMKAEMQKVFAAAREKVVKARALKSQGDTLVKSQGIQAANDTYVKARDLFREALDETEEWVEPELKRVTDAQVKDYMGSYTSERATWTTENAAMGKLHKD